MTATEPASLIESQTSCGPIHFRGTLTGRPVVLVILGSFAKERAFWRVPQLLPEQDVLIAHLPGNHGPWLNDMSLEAISASFEQALAQQVPDAAMLIAGVSTGALVALGIKRPNVRRYVLVEPPLRPTQAWPLRAFQTHGPDERFRLVGPVFGIYADRTEARDYSGLLAALDRPAHVLLGDPPPAEPTSFTDGLPSLVDEATRRDLESHPLVSHLEVPGVGHNIPDRAPQVVLDALRYAVTQL
jgi:hypothetical protein